MRQFGADGALARRLVDHVRAWDAAGRPSTGRMRVRAYRRETDGVSLEEEGGIVVEKRWTRLVLAWPTGALLMRVCCQAWHCSQRSFFLYP